MGCWLDKWAKRAATAAPTDVSASKATPSNGAVAQSSASSRRDFLKKAGIVGGVAWSIPVMQTVAAPMASASHAGGPCSGGGGTCGTLLPGHTGTCAPCTNGVACGASSDCTAGVTCSGRNGGPTVCGGPGATCTTANQATTCFYSNCSGNGQCGGAGTGSNASTCPANNSSVCAQSLTCTNVSPGLGWRCK